MAKLHANGRIWTINRQVKSYRLSGSVYIPGGTFWLLKGANGLYPEY